MPIDWSTLALQTLNVLILVWILSRFLFRPVRAIIAARQAEADKILAGAALARKQAEEGKAAAAQEREKIETERMRLLAAARTEADSEKSRLLEEARNDVARLRAEAAIAEAREKAEIEKALVGRLKALAVELARRLLTRVAPDAGFEGFVVGLCEKLRKMPARAIADLAGETGRPIDVVTAAPLTDEAKVRLSEKLEATFGKEHALAFHVDPALIAGLEIDGRSGSLRNSLREDLDRIAKELDFGGANSP